MDANALGTDLRGDITDRSFERGLCNPHHIIVLHDHLAAVIGHREQGAAILHQRLCEMRHAHE